MGHDTPLPNFSAGLTAVTVQADAPPVGSVEVATLPAPSTATHGAADGHDTPP